MTLAVVLALIIGMIAWFNHSLMLTASNLSQQIDMVNSEIRQKNWQAAVQQCEQLEQDWEKKTKWWPIF
jgi:hypothetical protein